MTHEQLETSQALKNYKFPSHNSAIMAELVQCGLATASNPPTGIELNLEWDHCRLNEWFRTLLPKAWNYLSKTHPFVLKDTDSSVMASVKQSDWPYLLATRAKGSGVVECFLHSETTQTQALTGSQCVLMSSSRNIPGWKDKIIILGK